MPFARSASAPMAKKMNFYLDLPISWPLLKEKTSLKLISNLRSLKTCTKLKFMGIKSQIQPTLFISTTEVSSRQTMASPLCNSIYKWTKYDNRLDPTEICPSNMGEWATINSSNNQCSQRRIPCHRQIWSNNSSRWSNNRTLVIHRCTSKCILHSNSNSSSSSSSYRYPNLNKR